MCQSRRSRPGPSDMHYLDANATQPLRPAARDAVLAALDITGNPSSVHQAGRAARRIMEDSREAIARRFGARPEDLVFTSGGTEADALAIHAMRAKRRLIISAIEHDAVRAAAAGAADACRSARMALPISMPWTRCSADGVPSLVCLMLANNETGVIQPVAAGRGDLPAARCDRCMSTRCRRRGAFRSISQRSGRTAWRCRRTSWADPRGPARCCWRRMRRSRAA